MDNFDLRKYVANKTLTTTPKRRVPVQEAKKKKLSYMEDLAEIDKQSAITAMEAKINKLAEMVEAKTQRLSMVHEDENLSELIDKKRVKMMEREIKEIERAKLKLEKLYEKMNGGAKKEVVGEEKEEDGRPNFKGVDYDYLDKLVGDKDAKVTAKKNKAGDIIVSVNGQTAFNYEDKGMYSEDNKKSAMKRALDASKRDSEDTKKENEGKLFKENNDNFWLKSTLKMYFSLKQDIQDFWNTLQDDAYQSDEEYEASWDTDFFIEQYPEYEGREDEINNIVKLIL